MNILRVKESFMLYGRDGAENRMFRAGDLIDASDAAVKGHEMFFQPVEDFVERQTSRKNTRLRDREQEGKSPRAEEKVTERATAEPGERRTVGRPRTSDKDEKADDKKADKSEDKATSKKDGEV